MRLSAVQQAANRANVSLVNHTRCAMFMPKKSLVGFRIERVIMNVQGSRQPVLMVIGTRPEAIKMVSVYHALKREGINLFLCSTAQHYNILSTVFDIFSLKPDTDLAVMKQGQNLHYPTNT